MKMVPEISLLNEHFAGQPWNSETQIAFMDILRDENYFNGKGEKEAQGEFSVDNPRATNQIS